MTTGADYLEAHPIRLWANNRSANRVTLAISRLIDKGHLAWDPETDETTVTDMGRTIAESIDWWWNWS